MNKICCICGANYGEIAFKGEYICDNCAHFLKENF